MDAKDLIDLHVESNVTRIIETLSICEADAPARELSEEARRLIEPVSDYETPAFDAGWRLVAHHGAGWRCTRNGAETDEDVTDYRATPAQAWEEACDLDGLEPDTREAYEFWIVTQWLAMELAARGHIVGLFGGVWVWGRVTTGAALHSDAVIQEIAERA